MTASEVVDQHRRSAQARNRRDARRRFDRPAARAPRRFPPRHEARRAVGDAPRRARASASIARAVSAARKSRVSNGIAKAACRCIRCAPTSITASPPRTPPMARAASRSGSSRAKSSSTIRWRRTSAWPKQTIRGGDHRRDRGGDAPREPREPRDAANASLRVRNHAATQAHQVPQGLQGPHPRRCERRALR